MSVVGGDVRVRTAAQVGLAIVGATHHEPVFIPAVSMTVRVPMLVMCHTNLASPVPMQPVLIVAIENSPFAASGVAVNRADGVVVLEDRAEVDFHACVAPDELDIAGGSMARTNSDLEP